MQNKQFSKDEDAQVGIGTMIVFIATILVAAVAAGVLIDTSQKLQGKATQTGNAATEQVGTALEFQAIYGKRDATTTAAIDRLEMWVDTAAGSDAIDLSKLIVQFKTSAATRTFVYDDGDITTACGTPCDNGFEEFGLYAETGTGAADDAVLIPGERNMILIGQIAAGPGTGTVLGLGVSTDATIELLPEIGINAKALINTPATFESKKVFELF